MALRCLPQQEQAFHLTNKNECLSLESVEGPEFSAAHQISISFGAVKFLRCIISEANPERLRFPLKSLDGDHSMIDAWFKFSAISGKWRQLPEAYLRT
jgi:hypothetical protein